jgi:hypothetical protein
VKHALIVLVALALSCPALAAQDQVLSFDHRVVGDRAMTIEMGPVLPLYSQSFTGTLLPANLTPGGSLGLDVDFYLNDLFRLGGGIRGMAAFGPNGHTLFVVPLMFRATWELKSFPWSFPVGFSTGVALTSYNSHSWIDPFVVPSAGVLWNMSPSWSFGLTASEWLLADLYNGPSPAATDSRLLHVFDLSLAAVYHF